MGSFSVWHWLIVLLLVVLPTWFGGRIARKAGLSGVWGLGFVVPLTAIITLWVLAFREWPKARPPLSVEPSSTPS